jgi:hypothetical protein
MAVHNNLIWGLLIEALSGLPKSKLFLSCHPGDRAQFAVDPDNGNAPLNIYGDLKTHTTVSVEILLNNLKTSDVLPGADLVVCWNSGSISVEAAHQRIPVIALSTEIGRRRTFFESNSEKWEPVELGVALEVEANPFKLRDKITGLLGNRDHVRFDLQKRQAEVYPKSEQKGSAVRKMADALEKLVK